MRVDDFDYELPTAAIAQSAIEPRDDSRVLIASDLSEIRFRSVPDLFVAGDVLIVNRTRVRAARLRGRRRPSGGGTELLLTKRVDPSRWEALLRPAKKLHVGSMIDCGEITAEVLTEPQGGVANIALECAGDIEAAIEAAGEVPLPPYFHGELASDERYQTVFARSLGSSAAPTAALHFTNDVVEALKEKGILIVEVELEVGLDTFRPMGEGSIEEHVIHSERIVVDELAAEIINTARSGGGRIIAVGTTVVRTLESAATPEGSIAPYSGETDLFIRPGYRFRVVDAMLTNFHAPRTTLIVMIAAALGDRWRQVYGHALESGFRFLSFGDSMYVELRT